MAEIVLLALGSFLGAATVRITGVGFALVATPFFVVAVGPWDAVAIIILFGCANGIIICSFLRSHIEWGRISVIAIAGMLGALPGTWLLSVAPPRALELAVGLLLLASLIGTNRIPAGRLKDTWGTRSLTGVVWGFFTAVAGLGAPPLAIYSRVTDWQPSRFAASVQPMFVFTAIPFMLMRTRADESWLPLLDPPTIIASFIALAAGILVGNFLALRLSGRAASWLLLVVAMGGALFTSVRAVVLWNQ
jgi:uncharacterized membrane protein YfcA